MPADAAPSSVPGATAMNLDIPFRRRTALVWGYARARLMRQVRAVAFITGYLALFQILVLRAPIADAGQIAPQEVFPGGLGVPGLVRPQGF